MLESVVMRTDHFCRSLFWTFRKCSTAVITSSSLSDWTPPGSSQAWCWGWVLDRFRCTPGWQPSPLWARGLMEDALLPSSPTTNRLELFCLTVLSVEGPSGRATLFQLVVFWTRSRETPALCQSKFINLSGSWTWRTGIYLQPTFQQRGSAASTSSGDKTFRTQRKSMSIFSDSADLQFPITSCSGWHWMGSPAAEFMIK